MKPLECLQGVHYAIRSCLSVPRNCDRVPDETHNGAGWVGKKTLDVEINRI